MNPNNGRRGPAVGENVTIGGESHRCIYVHGNDNGLVAADRVFAVITNNGIKSTSIAHGPFEYVKDESGTPFRGYF